MFSFYNSFLIKNKEATYVDIMEKYFAAYDADEKKIIISCLNNLTVRKVREIFLKLCDELSILKSSYYLPPNFKLGSVAFSSTDSSALKITQYFIQFNNINKEFVLHSVLQEKLFNEKVEPELDKSINTISEDNLSTLLYFINLIVEVSHLRMNEIKFFEFFSVKKPIIRTVYHGLSFSLDFTFCFATQRFMFMSLPFKRSENNVDKCIEKLFETQLHYDKSTMHVFLNHSRSNQLNNTHRKRMLSNIINSEKETKRLRREEPVISLFVEELAPTSSGMEPQSDLVSMGSSDEYDVVVAPDSNEMDTHETNMHETDIHDTLSSSETDHSSQLTSSSSIEFDCDLMNAYADSQFMNHEGDNTSSISTHTLEKDNNDNGQSSSSPFDSSLIQVNHQSSLNMPNFTRTLDDNNNMIFSIQMEDFNLSDFDEESDEKSNIVMYNSQNPPSPINNNNIIQNDISAELELNPFIPTEKFGLPDTCHILSAEEFLDQKKNDEFVAYMASNYS